MSYNILTIFTLLAKLDVKPSHLEIIISFISKWNES